MPSGTVVILSERRGRALADAVRTIAGCRIAAADERWSDAGSTIGVIVDVSLDRMDVRHSLKLLSERLAGRRIPLVCLMETHNSSRLRDAMQMGATACLPVTTESAAIVVALFRQIAPEQTLTDLMVEYSFTRAARLFTGIFETARFDPIDLDTVDDEVDPVLRAVREGGLRCWINLVQAHDDTTVRHCLLVAGLVANFSLHLGLSETDRASLVRAALVHDVGKARIPVGILNKPGPLDAAEQAVMRSHAILGHELLCASGMRDPVALLAARNHHELLDGSGYPDGLKGERIGDSIRLMTICDIYAALTERRPYRRAMPQSQALWVLNGMADAKLEKALVEAFADSLSGDDRSARPRSLSFVPDR